ncbi:MAG: ABC transporter ATP-binding protein [Candidatus Bipolaricaulota bacterium]|nr:ABC transporter ATP-binding protein [Candidatus Bipolaricaulota bacterium]
MSEPIIETRGLTKFYGKNRGIIDLDFGVSEGEVFGYLGPNGAGKTTTIRTLLDLIRPTDGEAKIFGKDVRLDGEEIRADIGYLPGELALFGDMTGEETLKYLGNVKGGLNWNYVEELADRLEADLSKTVADLSSGNKQKLGLIQAFMSEPRLLILDEPTSGLDPLMQQEFFRLIEEAQENGQTVFASSHILPVVERICDRVGIIRKGELVAVEEIDDLKEGMLRSLELQFAERPPEERFIALPGVEEVNFEDSRLRCKVVGKLDDLIKEAANYEVINVISHEPNLEEIFLKYYEREEEEPEEGGEADA